MSLSLPQDLSVMTIEKAKERMSELFPDQYHAVKEEITTHHNGDVVRECEVYKSNGDTGYGWFGPFPNFETAIDKVMEAKKKKDRKK